MGVREAEKVNADPRDLAGFSKRSEAMNTGATSAAGMRFPGPRSDPGI